jgi:ABC-type protease/lipase transport system fused ATPase/permease subunit
MRTGRTTTADLLLQGRRALAIAGGLAIVASLLSPVIPLAAAHIVEAAVGLTPLDALVPITVLTAWLVLIRAAIAEAADRIALRTCLWLHHTCGRGILINAVGRDGHRDATLADHAALDRLARAGYMPFLGAVAGLAVVPAGFLILAVTQPVLAAILCGGAGLCAFLLARLHLTACDVVARRTGAERSAADAWRLIAHNTGMLARQNLADGMIADWQGLNSAALGHAYRLQLIQLRSRRWLLAVTSIMLLAAALVGAAAIVDATMSIGAFVIALGVTLQAAIALTRAHDAMVELAEARLAWQHLATPVQTSVTIAAPSAQAAPHAHQPARGAA